MTPLLDGVDVERIGRVVFLVNGKIGIGRYLIGLPDDAREAGALQCELHSLEVVGEQMLAVLKAIQVSEK